MDVLMLLGRQRSLCERLTFLKPFLATSCALPHGHGCRTSCCFCYSTIPFVVFNRSTLPSTPRSFWEGTSWAGKKMLCSAHDRVLSFCGTHINECINHDVACKQEWWLCVAVHTRWDMGCFQHPKAEIEKEKPRTVCIAQKPCGHGRGTVWFGMAWHGHFCLLVTEAEAWKGLFCPVSGAMLPLESTMRQRKLFVPFSLETQNQNKLLPPSSYRPPCRSLVGIEAAIPFKESAQLVLNRAEIYCPAAAANVKGFPSPITILF